MNARLFSPRSLACAGPLLFLALLTDSAFAAAPTAAPAPVDPITEALPLLQADYVGYAGLNVQPADHLDDLVRRSQGAISLMTAAAPAPETPVISALLPGGTVYCRFASFKPAKGWADLAMQLKSWAAQGAQGLILDLRSTCAPDDFEGAAATAGLFLPTGVSLFTTTNAHGATRSFVSASPAGGFTPPMINGPIAVLTNEKTAGAAEALAACLKAHGALTLGRWTSGNGAEFAQHTLAGNGMLRYVVGQVTMADGSPLWRHAVQPDIGLLTDPRKEDVVLGLIAQNKILDVTRESAGSHRLSEAALVRGEDPAVEAYLVPREKPVTGSTPQDSVLIAALDSLRAIHVSQEAPATLMAEDARIPSTVQ